MLSWKPAEGECMLLCKRHIEIARICPAEDGDGWLVYLDVHHPEDTTAFSARSRTQAMNVAEMWAAKEGDRLDREIRSVVQTGEHRLGFNDRQ